jgi:putative ABC transport system permease protein
VTGVFFGTVASVVTVLPFSIARTGDASPVLTPGAYAVVVAVATVLTFAAAVGASRRAIAGRAVEQVGA